jgi:pimeloyl-ACP methyl ester carboxylesterase
MRDDEYLRIVNSTIVRSVTPPRFLPLLRAGHRALSTVAPGLAVRLAARWFLTPPRHPRPAAETALIATARARPVRLGADSRVETWRWGQGPRVVLVHGWGGRGSQLGALVTPLMAHGFGVVTFDAPGHGASPGGRVTVPEMVTALRAVAAEHGPIAAVVAHSAGSVVVTRALAAGLTAAAAVFLAPAADLLGPAVWFMDNLGFPRRVRDETCAWIERRVGLPWAAFDVPRLARRMMVPLLVVHDRDDAEVPWQHGGAIADAWPGARLLTTGGLGHRRLLRDPDAVAAAVAFVAARLAERRPQRAGEVSPAPDPGPRAIGTKRAEPLRLTGVPAS